MKQSSGEIRRENEKARLHRRWDLQGSVAIYRFLDPCVLNICQDGVGREAVGSLALDAVSRLGLPPVPLPT